MLTFPHMGNLYIPLKAIFEELDVDHIVPPPTSEKTLDLGQLYAPESACLPFKIHLGNFLEALEEGANTLLMIGGGGPCRLGLFAMMEELIMKDLGYSFTMVVLEPSLPSLHHSLKKILPSLSIAKLIQALFWGYRKLLLVEYIQERINQARPHIRGISFLLEKYLRCVEEAGTYDRLNRIRKEVGELPYGNDSKIGIIGDIYTILDPFSNMYIEDHLGELGVVPCLSVSISGWMKEHLFLRPLGLFLHDPIERAAYSYLKYPVGGLAQKGLGHATLYAHEGFLGAIQVFPLTCMPEMVAEGILPGLSRDLDFPILCIICDDERSSVGLRTRLEAFVDLLKRRRDGFGEGSLSRGRSRRDQDHDGPLQWRGRDSRESKGSNRCQVRAGACGGEDTREYRGGPKRGRD